MGEIISNETERESRRREDLRGKDRETLIDLVLRLEAELRTHGRELTLLRKMIDTATAKVLQAQLLARKLISASPPAKREGES